MISILRWLFFSRFGKYGMWIIALFVVIGFVWKHGYDTRADAEKKRRAEATAEAHENRNRIEDDISDDSVRDLCERLGGGMLCDQL